MARSCLLYHDERRMQSILALHVLEKWLLTQRWWLRQWQDSTRISERLSSTTACHYWPIIYEPSNHTCGKCTLKKLMKKLMKPTNLMKKITCWWLVLKVSIPLRTIMVKMAGCSTALQISICTKDNVFVYSKHCLKELTFCW